MVRTVYRLLNAGVPWDRLSESQQARYRRDAYFWSTAGKNKRFLTVESVVRDECKTLIRRKEQQYDLDSQRGSPSHSLRDAAYRASRQGIISAAQYNDQLRFHRKGNVASHTYGPKAMAGIMGNASSAAQRGSLARGKWADVQDDEDSSTPKDMEITESMTDLSLPKDLEAAMQDDDDFSVFVPRLGGNDDDKDLFTHRQCGDNNGSVAYCNGASKELAAKLDKRREHLEGAPCVLSQSFYGGAQSGADSLACDLNGAALVPGSQAQGYWQLQVVELRAENAKLYDNMVSSSAALDAQLKAAESALQIWISHCDVLQEQNSALQAELNRQSQTQLSAALEGRNPAATPASFETPVLGQNSSWSKNGFDFFLGQKSSLSQNFASKNPVLNISGGFLAGEAQANYDTDDHTDNIALRIQVLEQQVEKATASHGQYLERFSALDGSIHKLARSLGETVQRSLDERSAAFLDRDGLCALLDPALEQHKESLSEAWRSSSEALFLKLPSVLESSYGFKGTSEGLVSQEEFKVALRSMADDFQALTDHCSQFADSKAQVVTRDVLDAQIGDLVRRVELDTSFKSFAADFVVLQDAVAKSQSINEQTVSQLWEAFSLLKENVKVLTTCASKQELTGGLTGGGHTSARGCASDSDSRSKDVSCTQKRFAAARKDGDKEAVHVSSDEFALRQKFHNRAIVQIHSLNTAALNGEIGIIKFFDSASGRFAVELSDGSGTEKLIKAQNLMSLEGDDDGEFRDDYSNYPAHVADF